MGKKLAIKGHPTRGKEVIELLEMMDGKSTIPVGAILDKCVYTIIEGNILELHHYNTYDFVIFTLEEFLKKYPFKVGDKVIDKADGCPGIVTEIKWDEDVSDMKYCVTFGNGIDFGWFVNDSIDFLDVKEMKNVLAELLNHIKNTPKEKLKREFNELEEWSHVGPTVEEFMDFCDKVNKKPKYPKTYDECKEIVGSTFAIVRDSYKLNLFRAFYRLLICRDAYWKIAGEQMGLDGPWKPDYTDLNSITYYGLFNELKYSIINPSQFIFPTVEMRDAFYENFKDLIEQCKELL